MNFISHCGCPVLVKSAVNAHTLPDPLRSAKIEGRTLSPLPSASAGKRCVGEGVGIHYSHGRPVMPGHATKVVLKVIFFLSCDLPTPIFVSGCSGDAGEIYM